MLLIFGAVDLTNPQLQVSLANCSFVSISLGLVLASRCSLSLPDLLITVADEVCPLLSDCLPLAGMSCTERLSRVSIPSDVRPFVRYQLFSETNHRISLIFCIKLAFNKWKKVTKPDFQKKNLFGSNLGKLGPNLPKFQVFGQLFKFASLNFSDFAYFIRQT